jgi:hypothetical protein
MSKYRQGDTVRIITKDSNFTGELAYVVTAYADDSVNARVNDAGTYRFFSDEVDLVKAVDEDEQIKRIANAVLVSSEDHDDPFTDDQAIGFAERLYKAGCRFSG